jgi:hypothetical protein
MKTGSALIVAMLAAIASGCGEGQSSSESQGGSSGTNTMGPPPQTLDRLIEEGDIVWLEDSHLYILNQTRGLSIVGLAIPSAPVVEGQLDLGGAKPIELYLHNGSIAALTSNPLTSSGSRLAVIDVRTPSQPRLAGTLALQGEVSTSRLLGDILYTASDNGRVIQSVGLADASGPRLVDSLSLPLGTQGSHVHATPTTFYVATESYQGSNGMGECATSGYDNEGCTIIMAVDISAPTGALRLGSSYAMTGLLQDRWGIDAYDGVLRVLVGRSGWWAGQGNVNAALRTFKSQNAYQLDPLAWLPIQYVRSEKVMAVRFDGPRAYLVTFRQTDPLFAIDISDPSQPFVTGRLESPGWLDFIIPRGNRLLGIGRDRDQGSGVWHLQASLYDVSALAKPQLLSRVLFGGNYTTLPDQADNYAKVVRVVDQLGVLLVPHNETSVGYSSSTNGRLEVLSFANDALQTLGQVNSQEPIVRALPLPPSHVAAVTESAVGVIQIAPQLAVAGAVSLGPPVGPARDAGTADTGSWDTLSADQALAPDSRPADAGTAPDTSPYGNGRYPFDQDQKLDGGFHD